MICRHCGSRIDDDSRFCPLCGAKIEAPAPVEAPVFPDPAAPADPAEIKTVSEKPPVVDTDASVIHDSLTADRAQDRGPERPQRPDFPADRAPERPQRPDFPADRAPAYPMQRPVNPDRFPERPVPAPKEKEFFGVGAFVACIAVIAVLAISTGVFAYLYFSQIGII